MFEMTQELVKILGIDLGRLRLEWISSAEGTVSLKLRGIYSKNNRLRGIFYAPGRPRSRWAWTGTGPVQTNSPARFTTGFPFSSKGLNFHPQAPALEFAGIDRPHGVAGGKTPVNVGTRRK